MAKITTFVNNRGMVLLLIKHRGKQFQLSTGLASSGKFKGLVFPTSEKNHKAKTARLTRLFTACEDYLLRHAEESVPDMKMHLKAIITGEESKTRQERTLCEYMEDFAAAHNSSTATIYQTTRKRIGAYDRTATFDSVDKQWLEAYRQHETAKGRMLNGIAIDLRNIRAVFNWAIDNGYTTCYPFRKFTIKTERTTHIYMPADKLRELRDYPCEPYQEVYRDIFMLGFYLIGINIADLLNLKSSDLKYGRIVYRRKKTHRLYDIKVEPEAAAIIDKYRGSEYLLRFMDDGCNPRTFARNLGDALKRIGKMEIVRNKRGAYVKKVIEPLCPDITWYTARRSWATIAASLDIPKEVIGKALGHAEWDNTTTDIYIMFDNKKIDEANRRVLNAVMD